MKLLYLNSYFYPEEVSSAYLADNVREAFVRRGWNIEIYTPIPCRGVDSAVRKRYKSMRLEKQSGNKITVHRFPLFSEKKNPLQRAFRYLVCSIKHFFLGICAKDARKCNVLIVSSTPPIKGMVGAFVKKIRKIPFVYILQDIFPDSLVGTGMTHKGSILWKIGRRIENFTYRNADKIIVISQDFKRNIMAKGVPEEKIEVIYNWVDENAIVPMKEEENELFEEFGISRDKFRVVYAGNLGNAQNIEIIVDATRKLKDNPKIEFVIFGKGGLEDEIKQIKAKEQLDNLKILPLQSYERVAKVYGLGHVCIVACKPGLGGAAMPSKTWSIMSSGRAVLANFDEGELKEIVEKNHCGAFTKAGDLDGFVSTIVSLSQHPEQCAEMGANGRVFILNNLTRAVGTQKYVNVIRSVVNNEKH